MGLRIFSICCRLCHTLNNAKLQHNISTVLSQHCHCDKQQSFLEWPAGISCGGWQISVDSTTCQHLTVALYACQCFLLSWLSRSHNNKYMINTWCRGNYTEATWCNSQYHRFSHTCKLTGAYIMPSCRETAINVEYKTADITCGPICNFKIAFFCRNLLTLTFDIWLLQLSFRLWQAWTDTQTGSK